jgi:hypothetical protein
MLVPDLVLGRTRLAWLGDGPTAATPAAVKGELEKLAYLRGMDADTLDMSVLPAERRRQCGDLRAASSVLAAGRAVQAASSAGVGDCQSPVLTARSGMGVRCGRILAMNGGRRHHRTVQVKVMVLDSWLASMTTAVTLEVGAPLPVGVPEIWPVSFAVRPSGRPPMLHV